ncbi:MAG: hypothetical protein IPM06_19895 [Rhizobiales bacterium]|nr:hypothetical protein [Hyphomicrobiales bacterium]
MQTDIKTLLSKEISVINQLLHAHQIQAATALPRTICVRSSFIAYGLKIAPGQAIQKIEGIQRELSNELARSRLHFGYNAPCPVRVRDYPLAIEVPHPAPVPLDWRGAQLHGASMQALIGKSYSFTGSQSEYINLEKHYHMLVAAMSGAGKSTLMRMALATVALNTAPESLRIVLVDLKADDLVPFQRMPHVISLAANVEQASAAIRQVHELRDARIAGAPREYRLLLVIDELAELGESKEVLAQLGRILSTGRSLGINVWAGTQYPTAAAIGSIVSRSFTTRVVGRVDGAHAAQIATQRPGSYAHHLAHPGDFLRVEGPEMLRLKAFYVGSGIAGMLIDTVRQRWGASAMPAPLAVPTAAPAAPVAVDDMAAIVERIRPLWQQDASLAAMIRAAYGDHANTGGSNRTNVLKAVERLNAASQPDTKIIRLRAASGD